MSVMEALLLQVFRKIRIQEGANGIAESRVLRRMVQIHTASLLVRPTRTQVLKKIIRSISGICIDQTRRKTEVKYCGKLLSPHPEDDVLLPETVP